MSPRVESQNWVKVKPVLTKAGSQVHMSSTVWGREVDGVERFKKGSEAGACLGVFTQQHETQVPHSEVSRGGAAAD